MGTAAIILVLSVFNGLTEFIEDLFSAFDPDVKIVAYEGRYMADSLELYEELANATEQKEKRSGEDASEQPLEFYLSQMPPEWMQQVHRGAKECNDDKILQLLEDIPPENSSLARAIADLANNFLFDEIIALV